MCVMMSAVEDWHRFLCGLIPNDGDTIIDCTMGSGSTMVACANTNRKGIGIELMSEYYDIAVNCVKENLAKLQDK